MFVNGGLGLPVTVRSANDIRNCNQIRFGPRARAPSVSAWANEKTNRSDNANRLYPYATRWWPRQSVIIGGWIGTADDVFQDYAPSWIDPWTRSGANGRLAFVGYTRDQYGSPLGGCTVRCYRVSTEEMVSKVTSDANGLYFATSPYNDSHFIVIHNTAGDQAGATKNTLTPA